MRKFVIAIMFFAVFMAGCVQPVVKEEVKPAVPPVVKPAVPPAAPAVAVVDPATYALSKEDFEKMQADLLRPLRRLPWSSAKRSHWSSANTRQDQS